MTVNERLYEARLLTEFDEAVNDRDKNRMVEILKKVELSERQAFETAEAIIKSPSMGGY